MNRDFTFLWSRLCAAMGVVLVFSFSASTFAAGAQPDFGSPDELAGQQGTFEILGIKLGMPVDDALKALKAYNPKLQIGPQSGAFQLLPDLKITPAYVADEKLGVDGRYNRFETAPEHFLLLTTTAPSKAYVWCIWRIISYNDAGKRPLMSAFLESIKKKYGAPTLTDANNNGEGYYYWYRNKDGKPQSMPKNAGCSWAMNGAFDSFAPQAFQIETGWITRGVPTNRSPTMQTIQEAASPGCDYAAGLRIQTVADQQGRVSSIEMVAQNFKLGWSSFEITRQKLIDAQAAKQQQEQKQAGQQSGPQL